jgi:Ras GTPase-activating-like protein IQGAP2/3
VIGYFVYYRFMNVAIVTPDSHALTGKEVSMLARRNLVVVAKVLQTLFSLNQFQKQGNERWLMPLNNWIASKTGLVRKYLQDLIDVPDPSDYLRVDKYNELTLKISPVIIISLSEMFQTHLLILDNLSALAV